MDKTNRGFGAFALPLTILFLCCTLSACTVSWLPQTPQAEELQETNETQEEVLVSEPSQSEAESAADELIPTTPASLGLADGSYTCEVVLSGGSGKISVASPAKIIVRYGIVSAEIVWSSDKFDYMRVAGLEYQPISATGNSVFLIPVDAFDYPLSVTADYIALSTPHEIEYTLRFDSGTIQ